MSRWKYPFNTEEGATKHLKQAEIETGKKCFVRQVSVKAYVFKIFTSEAGFEDYQKKKKLSNGHK